MASLLFAARGAFYRGLFEGDPTTWTILGVVVVGYGAYYYFTGGGDDDD
jgi:hypothetical protein